MTVQRQKNPPIDPNKKGNVKRSVLSEHEEAAAARMKDDLKSGSPLI